MAVLLYISDISIKHYGQGSYIGKGEHGQTAVRKADSGTYGLLRPNELGSVGSVREQSQWSVEDRGKRGDTEFGSLCKGEQDKKGCLFGNQPNRAQYIGSLEGNPVPDRQRCQSVCEELQFGNIGR